MKFAPLPYLATYRQVAYALILLDRAGYSTNYMDSTFKQLGAAMSERRGKVATWLENMDRTRIHKLIRELRKDPDVAEHADIRRIVHALKARKKKRRSVNQSEPRSKS